MQKPTHGQDPYPLASSMRRATSAVLTMLQEVDGGTPEMTWVVEQAMILHDQIELELRRLERAEPKATTWFVLTRPSVLYPDAP